MGYKLNWGTHYVNHKQYFEGDIIPKVPDRHLKKWPDRFEEVEESTQKIDYEKKVKKYHKGGGYYDLPGVVETIQGKEKAIELLKEE